MSETIIIELGGRKYQVTCMEPNESDRNYFVNPVEAFTWIMDDMKQSVLRKKPETYWRWSDIGLWLRKLPEPVK